MIRQRGQFTLFSVVFTSPQTPRLCLAPTCRLSTLNLRVHTEWRLQISGVHPIMMEKIKISPGWWGWGVHAHPLSAYYHYVQSCSVRSCWVGRYTHPVSSLPYMYSVLLTTTVSRVRDWRGQTSIRNILSVQSNILLRQTYLWLSLKACLDFISHSLWHFIKSLQPCFIAFSVYRVSPIQM